MFQLIWLKIKCLPLILIKFPKIGSHVIYQGADAKVTGLNVINDLVKIENKNGIVFVRLDEIKFDKSNHAGKKNGKQRSR